MTLNKVKSERGSAFILALMVVAAVGLLVVPVIYLATIGLRSTNLAQQRFLERYASDAGVEEGIWHVRHDPEYLPLPEVVVSYTSTFNHQLLYVDEVAAAASVAIFSNAPFGCETVNAAATSCTTAYVDADEGPGGEFEYLHAPFLRIGNAANPTKKCYSWNITGFVSQHPTREPDPVTGICS